ncbi:MAG: L,D-transpeptidase [Lachnospiraceae bacterium]
MAAESEREFDVYESTDKDWVSRLNVAALEQQILTVAAMDNRAVVELHSKNVSGEWELILSAKAVIGRNGVGKASEGDAKTPIGEFRFLFSFGIEPNPGTAMPYQQINENDYWVDDPASRYYNRFVSRDSVIPDWSSAEHLIKESLAYRYVLALNYNENCVPGDGSAIFLHCLPSGGAGCIAVNEQAMTKILKHLIPSCLILIDRESEIVNH